jgi:hypothetical protein
MAGPPKTALFDNILHPNKRAFLLAYSECLHIEDSAAHADIDRQLHYHWLKTDPVYVAAFALAKEIGCEALESEAVRRAKKGVQRTIYYKASPIGEETVYSDSLLIFLLKGAMPEKYKDRFQVEHKGAIELYQRLASLDDLDDTALDDLAREVESYANGH